MRKKDDPTPSGSQRWKSTALTINLQRTACQVEIPESQKILLEVVGHLYGLQRQTEAMLKEFNHPMVNWPEFLKELKIHALGDFFHHNNHEKGKDALQAVINIFLDSLEKIEREDLREEAFRNLVAYLEKVVSGSGEHLERNSSLINTAVEQILRFGEKNPVILARGSARLKRLTGSMQNAAERILPLDLARAATLMECSLRAVYDFWIEKEEDPLEWSRKNDHLFEKNTFEEVFYPLSRESLRGLRNRLDGSQEGRTHSERLCFLNNLPDFSQISEAYLKTADEIEKRSEPELSPINKIHFLFKILDTQGLVDIHESALREINRCLSRAFEDMAPEKLLAYIQGGFELLKKGPIKYNDTVIDCVHTIGEEVYKTNNHMLVNTLIDQAIHFGFQHPEIRGVTDEWQVKVNPLHLKNIRAWLAMIKQKPRWSKKLLSALIINLRLGGLLISDTDLFQKDLSSLLNSDIGDAYNLVKNLARLFPVYFNEIGAEGELREISTRVDEVAKRKDPLIHFLRKQSHVESNNTLVPFVENIILFWATGKKEPLRDFLPGEVYSGILLEGPYFSEIHTIFKELLEGGKSPSSLLAFSTKELKERMDRIPGPREEEKERAAILVRLYQLLYKKYNLGHFDLVQDLKRSSYVDRKKALALGKALENKDTHRAIQILLDILENLKNRILSPVKTESFEDIYHKRHIAAGIPSMYGIYREEKFECMGLTFRLESLGKVLFEDLFLSLNTEFITKSTLDQVSKVLHLFVRALQIDGISMRGLESRVELLDKSLKAPGFTAKQYINIFQFISRNLHELIRTHFIDIHGANLETIIRQILEKKAPINNFGQALSKNPQETVHQISESFIRSTIAESFGLQVLDNLVGRIFKTLQTQSDTLTPETLRLLMNYDPEKSVSAIHEVAPLIDDQIHLGNKGFFLKKMVSFRFPVPPGFIITTEVFRCLHAIRHYEEMSRGLTHLLERSLHKLEEVTSKRFGDPSNPLLVSVRSGATMSMPGMMDTFLNVGISEEVAESNAAVPENAWMAWDNYRRFLQCWGMSFGLERDIFDEIINHFKGKYRVVQKREFTPVQMREIALAYRESLRRNGIALAGGLMDQLKEAVLRVFQSWYSKKACLYREKMDIAEEWGTAVIVQQMVFGNRNNCSGTGVLFTRNPQDKTPGVSLYGDFAIRAQGEDVVAGLVDTYPITEKQRVSEGRESGISLEKDFPQVYKTLLAHAEDLVYSRGFNHQEVEFTFENPEKEGTFVLQCRDIVSPEAKADWPGFLHTPNLRKAYLASGIGIGGGTLSGMVAFDEEEIDELRQRKPRVPIILLRPDTVPDDIGVILKADGLLTAKGGSTSHAAVIAHFLGKTCVVGCRHLKVFEKERKSIINKVTVKGGDFISIDGYKGSIYLGKHKTK